jgi:Reverse transcriptase (RNA-dependent DNA polymerase)/GAG-pre-integrase domain
MVVQGPGSVVQGSPSEDTTSSLHMNNYPILIGIMNVALEDRPRFWGQGTVGELFDCVTMKPVLTRLEGESEDVEPTAWNTLMELLWFYIIEYLDALMTVDEKYAFVGDSKGLTVLIGHPAMGDPASHRPRNFGTTLTNFMINFQSFPADVLARRPITILFEHRTLTRVLRCTGRLDGGIPYQDPNRGSQNVSPLMMDAPDAPTRLVDLLGPMTPQGAEQVHSILETVPAMGSGTVGGVAPNVGMRRIGGQGAADAAQSGTQGVGGQGAVDATQVGDQGVGGQGAANANQVGNQGFSGQGTATAGGVSGQGSGGQGAVGGNGAPPLAARWHQYGVRVRTAVDSVREHVARTPIFQPARQLNGGGTALPPRRPLFQVHQRTPLPRVYSNVNNHDASLADPHDQDDLSDSDRYAAVPPALRQYHDRPKNYTFQIARRAPAGPEDIYGSQVFLPEGKTYTLRLRWDQEKSLKTSLPAFGPTTTALEWYEALTTRLMSIGIFIPMYATLRLRQKMGTAWTELCEAHPDYVVHKEAWSSTIAQLLQDAIVVKKLFSHKAAAGGKASEILDTFGDDGYGALHEIMSHHAVQLNPPMTPRIALDQVPRFGDAGSIQVYVRRFKEYYVQLFYQNRQVIRAPEIYNAFLLRLPQKIGAAFRAKVWISDIQDREPEDWQISMIPKRLNFDTIADSIEDECRLSGIPLDEELKPKRRVQPASVQSSVALSGPHDEIDEHILMIQSARGTAPSAPCKYCHWLWPHEIHMCPRIVEALTIADFVKNKPDLVQKVRATHGDNLEHLFDIQIKERQARNANDKGKRNGPRAKISQSVDISAGPDAPVEITGDEEEEFVATAVSNDTSSMDHVSAPYFPHDSIDSCVDVSSSLHGLAVSKPLPPDECLPDASDWLPTTGLEAFIPFDAQDAPWFEIDEDPTVHIVPRSCLQSIASASSSSRFPWSDSQHGAHAHMDQGANISAVSDKEFLFCFRPNIPTRYIGDISGRCHATEGGGYLLLPVSTKQRSIWVPAYVCPALVNNIISPQALRRAYRMRYCTSGMGDDDLGGVSLEHRTSRIEDIYIPGIAVHAQLWNQLPAVRPTLAQRSEPLPKLADLLPSMVDCCSDSQESTLPSVTEPSRLLSGEETSKSGEDTLISSASGSATALVGQQNQHAFIATADSDFSGSTPSDSRPDRAALRMLWHQRLGHMSARRLKDLHKSVKGIPSNLPIGDGISQCPTCLASKMRRAEAARTSTSVASAPYEMLSIDFGFVVQKPDATKCPSTDDDTLSPTKPPALPLSTDSFSKLAPWDKYRYLRGVSGEVAYVTVVDHYSGALFGQTCTSKNPPIEWLEWFLSRHPCTSATKVVRMDHGGDLGGSRKVHAVFKRHGYAVQPTAPDAPHQNGKIERINQDIGNALRTMLSGAALAPSLWPYAFHHFVRLYNFQPHRHEGDTDAEVRTPYEILTGHVPDLSKVRTFGCRVYVRPPGGRKRKTADNTRKGQFLGYKATTKNILYIDDRTREIKEAFHVRFDEAFNDLVEPPPNAVTLRAVAAGQEIEAVSDDVPPGSHPILEICLTPFMSPLTLSCSISCNNKALGFVIKHDPNRDRGYIASIVPRSSAAKVPVAKSKFVGAFVLSINGKAVQHAEDIIQGLEEARLNQDVDSVSIVVSPDPYESPDRSLGAIHLDSEQLAAIHAVRSASSRHAFRTAVTKFRSAFDNGFSPSLAGIHSLGATTLGTPAEQSLSRFTRARLKQLSTWEQWRASEHKQLDNMAEQGMYGLPTRAPEGAIVLRSHWTYSFKGDGTRKARNCCDGSERAAPALHGEAKTYASCVEHPCMRIFFALSAVLGMTTFGADATNAFANSPPPAVPTFVRIDDAYADWYLERHGVELDRSMVLPVLHALQGHPESGSHWEQTINKILLDLGFTNTTHEPNLYSGHFNGTQVLLCRQVDDLAISCHDPLVADQIIAQISTHVTLTTQGVLRRFNGVDIDQTRDYVKISCESYIANMMNVHAWTVPSAAETGRLSEPLSPSDYDKLQRAEGFAEGTAEHRALETKFGFAYRSLLGELVYAYVVCRLDIAFAVTHLSKYSVRPAAAHFQALVDVAMYLRRTKSWGLMFWRERPCLSLPEVPFVPVVDAVPQIPFPECQDGKQLVAFADAAHGTDINTRRSISGISCMMAGAAVVFKSKTQSIAATSSTEAEFICAVHTAKIVNYLRSILYELGFAQDGPTPIYEDNRAAIDMVNASKPTERSRHIDIQHFAIQDWKRRNIVVLRHISGTMSPSDALTKPLSWVLHSRHTRRLMGHYGPPAYASGLSAASA